MSISFKSVNKAPVCWLSNFYGGSEFTYMSLRAREGSTLKTLYIKLRDNLKTYEKFNEYRDRLMDPCPPNRPRKKQKRGRYRREYEGKEYIAFGLIAKLISGCWRPSMKKRLKEVNLIAEEWELDPDIKASDFLDGDEEFKKGAMREALSIKFQSEPYRSYLISTGNKILYEQGKYDREKSPWQGKEGWLGKLLMELRGQSQSKSILGKRSRELKLKF